MKEMITTLCFLRKGNKVLLGKKKKGFGTGKYNGIGGKQEPGETIIDTFLRETKEEIGVVPTVYKSAGKVSFDETIKHEKVHLTFHLFIVTEWSGEIVESEEMSPFWFDIDKIPYEEMFADDIYWLPQVLEGKSIDAYFEFDEEWNILKKEVKEIENVKTI